ncbi:MAG: hypothetical protein ACOCRX_04535 [Candidatus Woesearchaeota archaeon]
MVTKENLEKILEEEGFLSPVICEDDSSYYDSLLSNEDIDCISGYHVENIFGSNDGLYSSSVVRNYLKSKFDF